MADEASGRRAVPETREGRRKGALALRDLGDAKDLRRRDRVVAVCMLVVAFLASVLISWKSGEAARSGDEVVGD